MFLTIRRIINPYLDHTFSKTLSCYYRMLFKYLVGNKLIWSFFTSIKRSQHKKETKELPFSPRLRLPQDGVRFGRSTEFAEVAKSNFASGEMDVITISCLNSLNPVFIFTSIGAALIRLPIRSSVAVS